MSLRANSYEVRTRAPNPGRAGGHRSPELRRQVRCPASAGRGREGKTLTRNPGRDDPFRGQVRAGPLDFSDPETLRVSMGGAGVLYNTYWIRFGHGRTTFDQAVENSKTLFETAAQARVGKVVHFSVANASPASSLPYFRGKGQVEEILKGMGIPHAIIRPTLVFGEGDLLLSNMAWALRRFPIFPVFGRRRLSGSAHLRRRLGGPGGGCSVLGT